MMGFTTESAVKKLAKEFICISGYKDKIASYRTKNGREMAIQKKNRTGVYIWFEKHNPDIPDIEVKNQKYPGMPYSTRHTRSSALNATNAPKLKIGNKAWYLRFTTPEALDSFLDWYKTQ